MTARNTAIGNLRTRSVSNQISTSARTALRGVRLADVASTVVDMKTAFRNADKLGRGTRGTVTRTDLNNARSKGALSVAEASWFLNRFDNGGAQRGGSISPSTMDHWLETAAMEFAKDKNGTISESEVLKYSAPARELWAIALGKLPVERTPGNGGITGGIPDLNNGVPQGLLVDVFGNGGISAGIPNINNGVPRGVEGDSFGNGGITGNIPNINNGVPRARLATINKGVLRRTLNVYSKAIRYDQAPPMANQVVRRVQISADKTGLVLKALNLAKTAHLVVVKNDLGGTASYSQPLDVTLRLPPA